MTAGQADPGDMQLYTTAGEAVFAELIDDHRPAVRAAVRAVLGRHPDEDDLVQEVFTRLLVRLRQPGRIDVGAWCWRSARNLAIDHIRRRSAIPTEDVAFELPCGDGLDREVLGREIGAQLAWSLRRLPDHHRRVLLAQLGAGDQPGRPGHAAVGAELGLSQKATESLLARARSRLRAELRLAGMDPGGAGYQRISSTEVVSRSITSGTGSTPSPGPSGTLR